MASDKSTRHNFGLLIFAFITLIACDSFSEISETKLLELRSQLAPKVQAEIDRHCGIHCPAFKIDLVEAKVRPVLGGIEDLGFILEAPAVDEAPKSQRVNLKVMTDSAVDPSQAAALKQILTYSLSNEVASPLTVATQRVNFNSSRLLQAAPEPRDLLFWLREFKPALWPATLLILAIIAMLALVLIGSYVLRAIREKKKPVMQPKSVDLSQGAVPLNQEEESAFTQQLALLLENRADDIAWLIQSLAGRADEKSLLKIVSLFSPEKLASSVQLNPRTLALLSRLEMNEPVEQTPENLEWLNRQLDASLWKRLHAQTNPLARIQFMSDSELQSFTSMIPSFDEKVILIFHLPREKWGVVLASMPSADRVEAGKLLHEIESGDGERRSRIELALQNRLKDFESLGSDREGVMENFILYLDESEGRSLSQFLTTRSNSRLKPQSLEALLETMPEAFIVELFLRANIDELRVLLPTLPAQTRARIQKALPDHLNRRLNFSSRSEGDDVDAQVLDARAAVLAIVRKFKTHGRVGELQ